MRRTRLPGSTDTADQKVFHKKHVVGAFWALVVAGISFAFGKWYSDREGPQKVIVTNVDTTQRVVAVGDTAATRYLENLVREMRALRRDASALARRQDASEDRSTVASDPDQPEQPALNLPQIPPLAFPQTYKGYVAASAGAFATVRCPARNQRPGAEALVAMDFRNQTLLPRVTPIFLHVLTPVVNNAATLLFDQQYEPQKRWSEDLRQLG